MSRVMLVVALLISLTVLFASETVLSNLLNANDYPFENSQYGMQRNIEEKTGHSLEIDANRVFADGTSPNRNKNVNPVLYGSIALGNSVYMGTTKIISYNQYNEKNIYYISSNGDFNIPYDTNEVLKIEFQHDSCDFENVRMTVNTSGISSNISLGSIQLRENVDRLLKVPIDYQDIQTAIDCIQNGGTVAVYQTMYPYQVDCLSWRDKHIRLVTNQAAPATLTSSTHAIRLDWEGIDNSDTIEGFIFDDCTNCNTEPDSYGLAIALENGSSPKVKNCTFSDNYLEFLSGVTPNLQLLQGAGCAVTIEGVVNQTNTPLFTNCTFIDNFAGNSYGGAAIGLLGQASFDNCVFENNQCMQNNGAASTGGAIYINSSNCPGVIKFKDCVFEDNYADGGVNDIDLIKCQDISTFIIDDCSFTRTSSAIPSATGASSIKLIKHNPDGTLLYYHNMSISMKRNVFTNYDCGIVDFYDNAGNSSLEFKNNIIDGCEDYGFYLDYYGGATTNPGYFKFTNNTFLNIDGDGLILDCGDTYEVQNNIFSNITGYGIKWGIGGNYATEELDINSCVFFANTLGNWDSNGANHTLTQNNIIELNPQLDANYVPVWSSSIKSPCINAGVPDLDGDGVLWYDEEIYDGNGNLLSDPDDRDIDLSRKDIGAKPLINNIENSVLEMHAGWNWLSLPGVDALSTGTVQIDGISYNLNQARYVFGEQVSPVNLFNIVYGYLDRILWNFTEEGSIQFNVNYWVGLTHSVTSPKGYKVRLRDYVPGTVKLEFDGFKAGSTGNSDTMIPLYAPREGQTSTTTLAGYYYRESQTIHEAIPANILQNVSCIKTQDWFAANLSYLNTQGMYGKTTWLHSSGVTGEIELRYGDAVEIVYTGTEDVSFAWEPASSGGNSNPYYVQTPTCFTYEEQKGYLPLIIEIDMDEYGEGDKPIEIAIFVNQECKGASVIKDDMVLLKAYVVDDPSLIGEELTFQLAFDNKSSKRKRISEYAVMDKEEGRFVTKSFRINNEYDFAYISLKEDDVESGAVPASVKLWSNYPNPFNPTTTIAYDTVKEGKVVLDVYNIKGQRVTTLVNETKQPGRHTVVWDGKDSSRKPVASGVYFYKLKTKDKVLTNKMMLLK